MNDPYVVMIEPDADALERSFLEALQRIMDGRPVSHACLKRLTEGPIRPSQSTVAEEAERSRTAISGVKCRLPRVQLEIKKARRDFDARRAPPQIATGLLAFSKEAQLERQLRRLRRQNTDLVRQRDAAFTCLAASSVLTKVAEKFERLADPRAKTARRAAEVLSD